MSAEGSYFLSQYGLDFNVHFLDALDHQLATFDTIVPPVSMQITNILTRRACDALQPVKSILSQFKAMSNKHTPANASYFIPSILRPVHKFFDVATDVTPGSRLKDDLMQSCATEVFESACHR